MHILYFTLILVYYKVFSGSRTAWLKNTKASQGTEPCFTQADQQGRCRWRSPSTGSGALDAEVMEKGSAEAEPTGRGGVTENLPFQGGSSPSPRPVPARAAMAIPGIPYERRLLIMADPRDKALQDYRKKLLEHKEIDGRLKECECTFLPRAISHLDPLLSLPKWRPFAEFGNRVPDEKASVQGQGALSFRPVFGKPSLFGRGNDLVWSRRQTEHPQFWDESGKWPDKEWGRSWSEMFPRFRCKECSVGGALGPGAEKRLESKKSSARWDSRGLAC